MEHSWSGRGERQDAERLRLAARIRRRRPQLDEELHGQMGKAVADDTKTDTVEYLQGRRKAVSAALDDFLETIEQDEPELQRTTLSVAVRAQVRRAISAEVPLDTVLMRYAAARGALNNVILRELAEIELEAEAPIAGQALHAFVSGAERTMALLGAEYRSALAELSLPIAERRQDRCVKALLANEPCDLAALGYEIDRWHVGVIAKGDFAPRALREVAAKSNGELLLLRRDDGQFWAWLGTRRRPRCDDVLGCLQTVRLESASMVTGEPAKGTEGFRRTHLQARAAQWVAARQPRPLTRYSEVILLSAVIRDPELERSLRDHFLSHFSDTRDTVLLDTLRAYFSCGHNISSAAAALRADRGTVGRRIRTVEQRIGRQLSQCQPELELALRLDEIDRSDGSPASQQHA